MYIYTHQQHSIFFFFWGGVWLRGAKRMEAVVGTFWVVMSFWCLTEDIPRWVREFY